MAFLVCRRSDSARNLRGKFRVPEIPKRVQEPTTHEDNYSSNNNSILLTMIMLSM